MPGFSDKAGELGDECKGAIFPFALVGVLFALIAAATPGYFCRSKSNIMTIRNNQQVTIFGATGKIGSEILGSLSAAGTDTIAVTRDLSKARELPFVKWMQADMSNLDSLGSVLENSRTIFLLSGHSNAFVQEQSNVVVAARAQGVEHIVKLSSGAADKNSSFHVARVHGEVEEFIKDNGIAYTFLRPNGFMQNWLGDLAQSVKQERKIYDAAGDGKRAYIDLRDIAEVAFRVLMEPEKHAFGTYLLTGGEAVNYEQIAAAISLAIGENVEFVALTIEQARQRMEAKGLPSFVIHSLLAYAQDQRDGKTAFVTNAVPEILGKPARSVGDFAKDYVGFFR